MAYTGRDAVINPSVVGIYSGWLKTRFRQARLAAAKKKILGANDSDLDKVVEINRELLQGAFKKEIEEKKKRATTRRTAPIRMLALESRRATLLRAVLTKVGRSSFVPDDVNRD